MSLQLIYTETFWWLISNLWSWQSKVFENWHHLLVVLYGYSKLHLNISCAVCVPYWVIQRCLEVIIQLCLRFCYLLFYFPPRRIQVSQVHALLPFQTEMLCASRCPLKKTHSNQETGSSKSQKKLMCDPALLESLQVLPLASMTIIDDL